MTASTLVADDMRRHLHTVMGDLPMSQNTTAAQTATKAEQPKNEVRGMMGTIHQAGTQAAASAGTGNFAADMAKLDEALANARIKLELPSVKETAIFAGVYSGVTALVLLGTFLALKAMGGSDSSSSSN